MIKNVEITGKILESDKGFKVGLYVKEAAFIDWFILNLRNNKLVFSLGDYTRKLLLMNDTYEAHIQLVEDLGLEMPTGYKKHWTPKIGEDYFYVDPSGEICPDSIPKTGYHKTDKKREENCNAFPTRELAEKAVNLSKLGRLILLWQFANDCLFSPDWLDDVQPKHYIMYDNSDKEIFYGYSINCQLDNVHFNTEKQAKEFVKMYSEEIKEIMGISQC